MPGTVQQELTRIIRGMRERGVTTVQLSSETEQAMRLGVPGQALNPASVSSAAFELQAPAPAVPSPAPVPVPVFPADYAEKVSSASWGELEALVMQGEYAPQAASGYGLFFAGHRHPRVLFIGDAPFSEESASGTPFSGPAGEMLYKMGAAMKLSWGDGENGAAVVNVMKYRPQTPPDAVTIERCAVCLRRQIQLLSPSFLVLMGLMPMKALTGAGVFSQMKGKWLDCQGVPAMVIQNPGQIIRLAGNQAMYVAERRQAWNALQEVMKRLEA